MQTALNKVKTIHPNKNKRAKPSVLLLGTQTDVTPRYLGLSRNVKKGTSSHEITSFFKPQVVLGSFNKHTK